MRSFDHHLGADDEVITVSFEGRAVPARAGESLAAALTASGIMDFRRTGSGAPRGLFCGMGVCQDCLVEIDGAANQLACMTKITEPVTVRRQSFAARPPAPGDAAPKGPVTRVPADPDILVVGGGIGGLSAASLAAEAGARVVLVDERPMPGGQFYKQRLASLVDKAGTDEMYEGGRRLIERAARAGVQTLNGTIWGAQSARDLKFSGDTGNMTLRPERLIVATGAFERPMPVPGWTLPGVMTTGAAQTLLRSYRVLAGKRCVIAGNGPLNLQVAVELQAAGAQIVALGELAAVPSVGQVPALWRMATSTPDLLLRGAGYLRALKRRRVPIRFGHRIAAVEPADGGLQVTLAPVAERPQESPSIYQADVVLMGYGFQPSNEILRLLDCRHEYDPGRGHLVTVRDGACATSVEHVYAIGDCCGLVGGRAAGAEGVIAGMAAAESLRLTIAPDLVRQATAARVALARHRRFQAGLWQLYDADQPQLDAIEDDTVICRCEEVTRRDLVRALADGLAELGDIKRATRLGMGRCQGRYCAPVLAQMLHQIQGRALDELAYFAPRAPVKPVCLADVIAAD